MLSNPYLISEPLSHQHETAAFILKKKYILDGSEMGTGKSLSAILAFSIMRSQDTFASMLVICPPGLVNNWKAEVTKHSTFKACSNFKNPDLGADIFILPYTQLKHGESLFRSASFVIADEAHYLKNMDSQRSRHFHAFIKATPPEYLDYASGTPLKNRIPEAYSMLRLWDHGPNLPKVSEKYRSYYMFCDHFCHKKESAFGTTYSGMKQQHVEELRGYILPYAIRHPASVLHLPELSESDVVVSYQDNKDLEAAFERFKEHGISAEITVKRDSAVATAKFTADYVRDALEQNCGPVVVFSDHVKPIEIMSLELSEFRVGVITGATPMSARQPLVDALNGGRLDVLLGTFGAMSSGFNMTGANLMIVNDPPWVPGDYEQAKKRILRLGQTRPCRIVRVIGSKVVDKIYKTIADKLRVINKVMENQDAE